jgi:hypothetical protein
MIVSFIVATLLLVMLWLRHDGRWLN